MGMDPDSLLLLLVAAIAGATALMAILQVVLLVAALRTTRRVNRLAEMVETEVRPTLERVDRMSADAARLTAAAADLAEQTDRLLAWATSGVDGLMAAARVTVGDRGSAFFVAVRAALQAFRGVNGPDPAADTGRAEGPPTAAAADR